MDPERKGWSAELLAMVQTAGGANGSDGQEGIQFKELDIDQAQKSTGAFGWTFKGAQNNVAKITYGLQKAEKLRQQKRKERREAQLRLQGQDRVHSIALAQSHASVAQREQERANARFAMERAQCLCPLSRLPMRWPVVAAGALHLIRSQSLFPYKPTESSSLAAHRRFCLRARRDLAVVGPKGIHNPIPGHSFRRSDTDKCAHCGRACSRLSQGCRCRTRCSSRTKRWLRLRRRRSVALSGGAAAV